MLKTLKKRSTPTNFAHDKTLDGWHLSKDDQLTQVYLPKELELVSIPNERNEDCIKWGRIARQAKEMKTISNQLQAEFLLKYEKEIPKEWETYLLLFPNTIWKIIRSIPPNNLSIPNAFGQIRSSKYKELRFPMLFHHHDQWALLFEWTLMAGSLDRIRLLLPRK